MKGAWRSRCVLFFEETETWSHSIFLWKTSTRLPWIPVHDRYLFSGGMLFTPPSHCRSSGMKCLHCLLCLYQVGCSIHGRISQECFLQGGITYLVLSNCYTFQRHGAVQTYFYWNQNVMAFINPWQQWKWIVQFHICSTNIFTTAGNKPQVTFYDVFGFSISLPFGTAE